MEVVRVQTTRWFGLIRLICGGVELSLYRRRFKVCWQCNRKTSSPVQQASSCSLLHHKLQLEVQPDEDFGCNPEEPVAGGRTLWRYRASHRTAHKVSGPLNTTLLLKVCG